MILIVFGIVIIIAWIYILFVREWLAHESPWAAKFQWIHSVEDKLWDKSRTMLVGRLYWLGGIFVGLQTLIAEAGFNTQPLLDEIGKFIPEKYRGLALGLFLFLTGISITWLRKRTTTSLEDK